MSTIRTKDSIERVTLLQGTLDMLILRTLRFGAAHGHQIAKHIQRTTEEVLQVEHGSGSEGRRRGGCQHMKCADRQMEELTEDKQTPCSNLVDIYDRHTVRKSTNGRVRRIVQETLS